MKRLAALLLIAAGCGGGGGGGGESAFGGWARQGVVLLPGGPGEWDEAAVTEPCVLFDGALFHLWYGGESPGSPDAIGYATSPDGATWTKQGVALAPTPGTFDQAGAGDPSVFFDGALFRMYYTGEDAAGVERIGLATSTDGIAWTKAGAVLAPTPGAWDEADVFACHVFLEGTLFRMWYSGGDASDTTRIGYAESVDGATWVKSPGPVLDLGASGEWDDTNVEAPTVLLEGGVFRMFYAGEDVFEQPAIGEATSSDGVTWTRQGMVLMQGQLDAWDDLSVGAPCVLRHGGLMMWYEGDGFDNDEMIGLAMKE